ncbi:GDP-L-fucose synthase [Desulfurivibrio alkaliphilus]|uniref:GDP-L-fucose synthase n=1 Tax=Desulfurivibrio alkaliphilus (strain DSM 19089 / UNIQEM U267 / AHT2) TaxID=589865 RepID=D6YZQ9_DESAT|nr:GDP-L-fucose synthase [Desulfurivibrio alkaliphilus]ADH85066.1 NAD-dependent epimerase/dehydratase [Desulfurivibrio alkaliphilus AHT 2]
MTTKQRVYVAGHRGMVGSAIVRQLAPCKHIELITRDRSELDLQDQKQVSDFFRATAIDQIYLAAAKAGGILANNSYPAEFIYENLMIACNIIHAAHTAEVNKLLFLGSSCIYPKLAPQPMREEALLDGFLESTNEPYAVAKIAGIKLCESYNRQHCRDYRSIIPTNLYGPNDNFHPLHSHVIPALLRRIHQARETGADEVVIWGSGSPRREFLHVDDLATAAVFLMNLPREDWAAQTRPMRSYVNVGTGLDCTIAELAATIANITGFTGRLVFDRNQPDGTPRKLLDISRIKALGWQPQIPLERGLRETYHWLLAHQESALG